MGPWVVVAAVPDRRGRHTPGGVRGAYEAWLRANGIDWNPFADDEVRIDTNRSSLPDGGVGCAVTVSVRADALRRLGIEPPAPH